MQALLNAFSSPPTNLRLKERFSLLPLSDVRLDERKKYRETLKRAVLILRQNIKCICGVPLLVLNLFHMCFLIYVPSKHVAVQLFSQEEGGLLDVELIGVSTQSFFRVLIFCLNPWISSLCLWGTEPQICLHPY